MRKAVASFVFLAAVLVVPALATAQGAYVYMGPYYRITAPPPPPPRRVVVYAARPVLTYAPAPVQLDRRWGVGLRYLVNSVNQTVAGEDMVMSGGGVFTRYRHSRYWGFELGFDGAASVFGDERFKKSSFIPTASLLFHLTPRGVFDLHLIGGIGGVFSTVEVQNPPGHPDLAVGRQHLGEFQAHLGIGCELRLGRSFGIVSDLRYIGRVLDTTSQDGRWYKDVEDGVIPSTSQGVQFTAGLMLHF